MSNTTQDTLDLLKTSISASNADISKSITTASGLVSYDLRGPAKNLYPVNTPVRNRIARRGGGTGTAVNWKSVQALTGSGFDAMGWVPEGQRSGRMSYTVANKLASYVTLGEEDQVSYEAMSAANGFEDVRASMTMRLLQKTFLKEESAILFGNATLALGTPATAALAAAGTGATLPAATYSVIVVALTGEGYRNSSLAGGVATTQTITGADGQSFTLNGGSSAKSAAATQAVTLGQTLSASVTPIQGAVAYAWFVGTSGSEKLEKISVINSAVFNSPLAGTGQTATSVVAGDKSLNAAYAFDGLFTTAYKAGSGAYINSLATGVAGAGTALTSSGRGSVNEIDTMLQNMWDNYQISPTVLLVNSQELKNITNKVLSNASGPLVRYDTKGDSGYELTASGYIANYFNPFSNFGGVKIPLIVHPSVPAGTIIGWAENLPIQYQSNGVPNVAEVITRRDYYQIDWPVVTRSQQVGVYTEQTLAVYAPFAVGIITNIANA